MIDPTADRAVFRQLADLLRSQITSGELAPGARVRSELGLAQEHGLSRTTVRQALGQLRAEGLIVVKRRPRGTFVREDAEIETVKLERGDMASARMPTPDERRALKLGEGVPVLVVTHADGSTQVYAGDRTRVGR